MNLVKTTAKAVFNSLGLEIQRRPSSDQGEARMPVELTADERDIVNYVKRNNLSMVSDERLWATLMACKYAVDQGLDGDFVECGVWRGGNALIAAALFRLYDARKKVYLFDTFEGMTAPTEKDRHASNGASATDKFMMSQRDTHNEWCYASLEDVQRNFEAYGLLGDNAKFIKGDVCKTLEVGESLPDCICVLRLDTDWYESTKRELEVLYPRLITGGVLLIDDYGHWAGARDATDEYFSIQKNRPFLHYTDYTGRLAVKTR